MTNVGRQVFGSGAILMGAIGIVSRDFALVWQPVPPDLPGRTVLAVMTGMLLVLGGVLACSRRRAAVGGAILWVMFALCVLLLHMPDVFAHPGTIDAYAGVAEQLSLTCGGALVFANCADLTRTTRQRLIRGAVVANALCLLVFGAVHFYYGAETAAYVPAWLPPGQLFWAYATGVGHIAAGIALLIGVWSRLAMRLLVLMFVSFSLFVHIPRLISDVHSHFFWVMNAMNLCLIGAAWVVMEQTGVSRNPSTDPSLSSEGLSRP